jgi:hypothetical protein
MAIIIPQATNGPAIDPINVHVVWPSWPGCIANKRIDDSV